MNTVINMIMKWGCIELYECYFVSFSSSINVAVQSVSLSLIDTCCVCHVHSYLLRSGLCFLVIDCSCAFVFHVFLQYVCVFVLGGVFVFCCFFNRERFDGSSLMERGKFEGIDLIKGRNICTANVRHLFDRMTLPSKAKTFHGEESTNDNNNDSYIALYPVKIHEFAALYIINIKIHLTIKKAQVL